MVRIPKAVNIFLQKTNPVSSLDRNLCSAYTVYMKIFMYFSRLLFTIAFSIALSGCAHLQNRDIIYQNSPISSLMAGVYDGETSYRTVRAHGDFGLGTFNGLDGEMVGLEGEFFQITVDGRVHPVDDSMKTPFVVVTFFEPDLAFRIGSVSTMKELEQYLDALLPSRNILYAIRISGIFEHIKARSVPKQHTPYPPLAEAVQQQAIFEFHAIEGTLVGFRSPAYAAGINVPGYHFHFISKDRRSGGHLLDCSMQDGAAAVDSAHILYLTLPGHGDFYRAGLAETQSGELVTIERNGSLNRER